MRALDLALGLHILTKCMTDDTMFFMCDHDEYAIGTTDNTQISAKDKLRLISLGFWEGNSGETWHFFQ